MHYAPSMTVADFYARKSNKDDGRSVASQEEEYRDDCTAEGLTPGRTFADPDKSASRYARKPRPDYAALLEHVRSGGCEMLSLWEASRGSRKLGEWVDFIDLCRTKGVLIRVISHRHTYDPRKRRDYRTLAEEGIDSADESEKISERTRRGKRAAAKAGRPDARLAYGFRRIYDDRGKFMEQVEHPVQGPVVKEIIEAVADGAVFAQIAASLNTRGIKAPLGGLWTGPQVRSIAVKPSYAGLRVYQGEVFGDGCWDPIVDPDIWIKAHLILISPGRKTNNDSTLTHWLTGAVHCGLCSGPLGSSTRPWGAVAYRCRGCHRVSTGAQGLEAVLRPLILQRLGRRRELAAFLPQQDTAGLAAANKELKQLKDRLNEFRAEGRKPDGLSAAAVAEAEHGLSPLIAAAQAKVTRLSLPPELAELEGVDLVAEWDSFPARVQRDLTKLFAHIVLAPGSKDGGRRFDQWRLAESRWVGDKRTWGEIWG